jgi:hypothetical protein
MHIIPSHFVYFWQSNFIGRTCAKACLVFGIVLENIALYLERTFEKKLHFQVFSKSVFWPFLEQKVKEVFFEFFLSNRPNFALHSFLCTKSTF